MKQKSFVLLFVGFVALATAVAAWRTPITKYRPRTVEEKKIEQLFIRYVSRKAGRTMLIN